MKVINSFFVLFVAAVLLAPPLSMAKMAINLEQKVALVQAQSEDGTLYVENDEAYQINNKEIRRKAATLVGNQARLLFFIMAEEKICVDIAPVTDPPFEINVPSLPKRGNRPL